MKLFLLSFFVAAAVAIPIPDDENNGNIDVIVNGVPEGKALDIEHIIGIYTHEKVNGELVAATNVLHPFTAVGIAEATAAAEAELAAEESVVSPVELETIESVVIPEPVVLPEAVAPEVVENDVPEIVQIIPTPVVLPEPASPVVVPEPVVLPEAVAPVVVPEVATPIEVVDAVAVAPEAPATPVEVIDAVEIPQPAEALPAPALQTGEVFNNGIVTMHINSQEPGLLSTLQSWFNIVVNYVTNGENGVQTQTTQIV